MRWTSLISLPGPGKISQVADVLDPTFVRAYGRMETFEELLCAWSDAEARGDTAALDPLLAVDFQGDGPLGFVLDKERWLDRYRRGDLRADLFVWAPAQVRVTNRTAVAIGTQSQIARYRGQDCSGAFTCTLVAVRRNGRWTIVNLQISKRAP